MTVHFAYPNVLPRQEKFIGCGRYTICEPGALPGSGYTEVQGVPNTPNKIVLNRVAQLLAPQSYDSPRILVHRQDREDVTYQGDSLDLAWLLSHVLRSYKLYFTAECNIWCTGVVQLDSSGPYLLDVEQSGFYLKLAAFLDPSNQDCFFLVPLPNLTPRARRMCEKRQAEIKRLDALVGKKSSSGAAEKVIITVASDELPLLLQTLFVSPVRAGKSRRKWLLLSLLAAVLLAILLSLSGVQFSLVPAVVNHPVSRDFPKYQFPKRSVDEPVAQEKKSDEVSMMMKDDPEQISEEPPPKHPPYVRHGPNSAGARDGTLSEAVRLTGPSGNTTQKIKSELLNIPIDYEAPATSVIKASSAKPQITSTADGRVDLRMQTDATQQHPVQSTGLGRKLTDDEW